MILLLSTPPLWLTYHHYLNAVHVNLQRRLRSIQHVRKECSHRVNIRVLPWCRLPTFYLIVDFCFTCSCGNTTSMCSYAANTPLYTS